MGAVTSRTIRAAAIVVLGACASAQRGPAGAGTLPLGAPAAWERVVPDAYENRGLAQVERLGRQWVLKVFCDGTHSTYIDSSPIDLTSYRDGYVVARYRYVERMTNVQCAQGPCPPVPERRIALEQVRSVKATADSAADMARVCR